MEFSTEKDLTVVMENEKVEVHSLILMMVSPVFKQMLSANMEERKKREIILPDGQQCQNADFDQLVQAL